ncbi:hypothetical protein MRB53_039472 [Persea americana]|nr:hypothetical protein MRB53_039472 [Persea americana]
MCDEARNDRRTSATGGMAFQDVELCQPVRPPGPLSAIIDGLHLRLISCDDEIVTATVHVKTSGGYKIAQQARAKDTKTGPTANDARCLDPPECSTAAFQDKTMRMQR